MTTIIRKVKRLLFYRCQKFYIRARLFEELENLRSLSPPEINYRIETLQKTVIQLYS